MDKIKRTSFFIVILVILLNCETGCNNSHENNLINAKFFELTNLLKENKEIFTKYCQDFKDQKNFRQITKFSLSNEPWYVKFIIKYELILDFDLVQTNFGKDSYVTINFFKSDNDIKELYSYDRKEMNIVYNKKSISPEFLYNSLNIEDQTFVIWGNFLLRYNFSRIAYSIDFPNTISLGYFYNFNLIYSIDANQEINSNDNINKIKKIDEHWYLYFSR